jgi:uncharacterized membrane-anchored protein
MKTVLWIIFGLAALAQWAVPLSQIRGYEQTLTQGTVIKLKCTAPDPYDPLRGRYLIVRPELQEAKVPEGMTVEPRTPIYATLTTGADGLATITHLSHEAPKSGDYIRLKTTFQLTNHTTGIEWPFDRFYINEKLAPEADKWFAENIRSETGIIAEVRLLRGQAVLADLSIEGQPFREILKARTK